MYFHLKEVPLEIINVGKCRENTLSINVLKVIIIIFHYGKISKYFSIPSLLIFFFQFYIVFGEKRPKKKKTLFQITEVYLQCDILPHNTIVLYSLSTMYCLFSDFLSKYFTLKNYLRIHETFINTQSIELNGPVHLGIVNEREGNMLHKVAKIGENRNQNLQEPLWALLKSISSGRTTRVQTHQSFHSQPHGVRFCPQLHTPNFHSSRRS